jgi:hypothetical protein
MEAKNSVVPLPEDTTGTNPIVRWLQRVELVPHISQLAAAHGEPSVGAGTNADSEARVWLAATAGWSQT